MKNKSLYIVLGAVLFLAPVTIFAQQGDIDTSNAPTCAVLNNNLKYSQKDTGSSSDISMLQDFLNVNKYLSSQPSGFFGRLTLTAVKAFQKANNISPTGYVGAITRAKIKEIDCATTTVSVANTGRASQDFMPAPTLDALVSNGNTALSMGSTSTLTSGSVVVPNSSVKTTVTFPTDGSVLMAGQSYNITWLNKDSDSVNYSVYLYSANNDVSIATTEIVGSTYLGSVNASKQTFVFKVPANIHANTGYKIYLKKTSSDIIESSPFTIKTQADVAVKHEVVATLSLDPSTPKSASTPVTDTKKGELRGLPVLTFDIKADSGDLAVKSLAIHVNTNATCCAFAAYLYKGDVLIGSASEVSAAASPTGVDGYTFINKVSSVSMVNGVVNRVYEPIFTIPQGVTQPLTVKLDFGNIYSAGINAVASTALNDIEPILNPSISGVTITGSAKGNMMTVTNK